MYFVIYKNPQASHPYWWVIKSDGNHETLCSSEMLASKQACIHAIDIVHAEDGRAVYHDRTGE